LEGVNESYHATLINTSKGHPTTGRHSAVYVRISGGGRERTVIAQLVETVEEVGRSERSNGVSCLQRQEGELLSH
jgi:hypothetical protein